MMANFLSPDALIVKANTKLSFSGDFAILQLLISLSKKEKNL